MTRLASQTTLTQPSPKRLLLDKLQELTAAVEALPDDVFGDGPGRHKAQGLAKSVNAALEAPKESIFKILFQPHQSAATMIAIDAGWLKVLEDGKPKTSKEIGSVTASQPELIERIMMPLTATGVVGETGPQTYVATPISQTLLGEAWGNGLRHCFGNCAPVMLRLPGYLQRNGYRNPDNGKTSPFADTYGMHSWDYFRTVAEKGRIFNSFMTMVREWAKKLYEIYPVESLLECLHSGTSDSPWLVVDVGGGQGHVMQQLVAEFPQFKGHLIVQDLPATVGDADKLAADGIKAMKYDFTTPQPIKNAKVYYLRQVLHDWPDKDCLTILRNLVPAMQKGYSKVLIDELVLPDVKVDARGAMMDLSMLAMEAGQERKESHWHELLRSAGLRIEKVWASQGGLECIIEAVLDDAPNGI